MYLPHIQQKDNSKCLSHALSYIKKDNNNNIRIIKWRFWKRNLQLARDSNPQQFKLHSVNLSVLSSRLPCNLCSPNWQPLTSGVPLGWCGRKPTPLVKARRNPVRVHPIESVCNAFTYSPLFQDRPMLSSLQYNPLYFIISRLNAVEQTPLGIFTVL